MTSSVKAFALGFVVFLGLSFAAPAQGASEADKRQFQDIIASQIDAFQRDDGLRAFSFAAPTIRSIFRTAEGFMQMVRNGYKPVYRPQSVKFGTVTDDPKAPIQKVHLIGPDGGAWTALYAMQRQDDGSWKISGVTLIREDGAGA